MKIAQAAVNRPVLTSMVSLIVIILGAVALSRLPIDIMPDVTSPTISISTSYSKASPLTMEELVTRPIEEAVAAVPGVQEISSRSTEGNSNVQVSFSWGTDLEAASNDIRDRIDRIISRLPSEAGRPSLRKFDMAATPVIMMGVTSQLEALELRRILEEQVSYRLERVNGVASVNIWGGRTREIHINLDPARMNALKVPLDQVISRIRSANVNQPAGNVYRGNHQITVRVPGLYENLDELRNTVIMRRGGSTIALRDIAEVIDTASKETRIVRINGEAGIQISVNKQSGTNTVKVVQGILEEVEQINRSIPQIKVVPLMDSSVFIKQSINNVSMSALLGGILAVLILLFFLRNLTSTLVISTAIPISIMATFGLLYFNGFTLNLMTIGALALGVGQLLDNSIVVMENIFRHREMGKSSQLAAVDGSMEVGSPILASTLTSIVVFLPLLFMRGMSGIMFQQLAFVVVFALICSLITAITLVPMLSGKIIKVTQEPPLNAKGFSIRIYHGVGSILRKVENWYQMLLCKALNHRAQTLVIVLVMLAGAAFLASVIDSELMPISDEGEIIISIDMEAGTQLELVDAKMLMAEERIKDIPEITNIVATAGGGVFVATAGGGGWGSSNTGSLRISLLSKSERERSDEEIAADMRDKLANIPGARVRVRTVSNNRMTRVMGGGGGRIAIQVRGHEMDEAYRLASIIVENVESVEGITDVNLSRTAGAPEDLVQIDRQKAAELGLSVQQISSTLETVLSGTKAGDYMDHGKEYPLMVQVKDAERLPMNEILDFSISNTDGNPIVLRNVVDISQGEGSTVIERVNQERMIDVSANLSGRNLSAVIGDIQDRLDEIPLPTGFSVEIVGDYKEQQESFRELTIGIILALVLIYMVMASQFESIRDPFIVMFSVPFALIGVSGILYLTGTTFNIQTYIGIIMLAGIVVNNAILLVNTTNQLRDVEGMKLRPAIEEAGRRRLRPILMTALSTVLGLLPMAIGLGEGSETQAPLARAVVGGLLSSTFITLVLIPVLYSLFEGGFRTKNWAQRCGRKEI